jgi:phosphoenolpyruvate phosphomutase
MTKLENGETILSRQISQLEAEGVGEIVITTGPFVEIIERHARESTKTATLKFVNNPIYAETNYIYSIFLAREFLSGDILLLHGDLVFYEGIISGILACTGSAMTVSSSLPLPDKDFKAVIEDGRITKIGIEPSKNALAAQPLYKLCRNDWDIWMSEIIRFVDAGITTCYAENAFNRISHLCNVIPFDTKDRLCAEIDNLEDLGNVNRRLHEESEA